MNKKILFYKVTAGFEVMSVCRSSGAAGSAGTGSRDSGHEDPGQHGLASGQRGGGAEDQGGEEGHEEGVLLLRAQGV